MRQSVESLARSIYGTKEYDIFMRGVALCDTKHAAVIAAHRSLSGAAELFGHKDIFLIAYGDQFSGDAPPLAYLGAFLAQQLADIDVGLHILPFFPSTSDAGFSVKDYHAVDPALGEWGDIEDIADISVKLMVDMVCNHCSSEHQWFSHFLDDTHPYNEYFIAASPSTDVSGVFRPRVSPLLHRFAGARGDAHVWTTFSADQVDLNYTSPHLFVEIIDILFHYISHGARVIRLDAVAYLWKEIGTPCIHHRNTHTVVKLIRGIIEARFPSVLIITETNVPHRDNIRYFGDGDDEAHLVYNFALPPLVLDAFIRGDARHLTEWAKTLQTPSPTCTFFNFLASHDGIGILSAYDYLNPDEIANLLEVVRARGGHVSYKQTAEGSIPYELNINYLSALTDPDWSIAQRSAACMSAQAIMCACTGIPAPYIQSVLGSENWSDGVARGLGYRSINREKFRYDAICAQLATEGTLREMVFSAFKRLIRARTTHPSFHPHCAQRIVQGDARVCALVRGNLLCLHNTSSQSVRYDIRPVGMAGATCRDIIADDVLSVKDGYIRLAPYQYIWAEYSERKR